MPACLDCPGKEGINEYRCIVAYSLAVFIAVVFILKSIETFIACFVSRGIMFLMYHLSSRDVRKLPVKLTDPVTPILYVTADKQHMEELKHAIHVKSIDEG